MIQEHGSSSNKSLFYLDVFIFVLFFNFLVAGDALIVALNEIRDN
jgi:hypothetical protein